MHTESYLPMQYFLKKKKQHKKLKPASQKVKTNSCGMDFICSFYLFIYFSPQNSYSWVTYSGQVKYMPLLFTEPLSTQSKIPVNQLLTPRYYTKNTLLVLK